MMVMDLLYDNLLYTAAVGVEASYTTAIVFETTVQVLANTC